MPKIEEIPKTRWVRFLDGFSREHEGWQVTVEVQGSGAGRQVETQNVPLQGISADLKPSGERDVSIILGTEHNPALTHIVPEPAHLRLHQTDSGADESLEIEATDGTKTLVRFRVAMQPETVNG